MRSPVVHVAAVLALGAAFACGSLDIDALGAGHPDGGVEAGQATVGDGGAPSSTDAGTVASADGGFHTTAPEADTPWVASGWKVLATGSTDDLEAVWGATSKAVWAGGKNGAFLFFDGAAWAPAASSIASTGTVRAIAGSATDDVYLLEERGAPTGTMILHHYDGTAWAEVSSFAGVNQVGCLDVPTRRVAYVYGAPKRTPTVSAADALRLYRVDGRSAAGVKLLGTSPYVATAQAACGVHAFAPDDVWVTGAPVSRFDGAGFVALPGAPDADLLSVVSRTLAFTSGEVWNGTSWQSKWTGVPGTLLRVSGRTDALAFGAVYGGQDAVVRWAGGTWVEEPLPVTFSVRSVYMAPNGRTFAVGRVGMVVSGP